MVEPLKSVWDERDFPVLVAAARLLEEGDEVSVGADEIAEATGINEDQVMRALGALENVFTTGNAHRGWGGAIAYDVYGLTERGRRAVGLWPSGDAADALVDALRQAEAATDDPEEQSLLRRAGAAVSAISRGVMTDVMAAYVKSQTGLS